MNRQCRFLAPIAFISALIFQGFAKGQNEDNAGEASDYNKLVTLFQEFREFYHPKKVDGIPDYTAIAMAEQFNKVQGFQQRLSGIVIDNWSVAQQVDYHVVRAEINGLVFEHRVRRPWARDPSFYLFSAAGAGPVAYGRPEVPHLPMPRTDTAKYRRELQAVSGLLQQARENLSEASGDLARFAIHFLGDEVEIYQALADQLQEHHPELVMDVNDVIRTVKEFGVSHWNDELLLLIINS